MVSLRLDAAPTILQPPRVRKHWPLLMLLAAVALAAGGLSRLRFDTDVLSLLPGDLPEVKGLKARHAAFAREDEAILLVETTGAETAEDAAKSLATVLEKDGVVKRARWRPLWEEDPAGLAELVAYAWINGNPEETRTLSARLAPETSPAVLKEALENISSSLEGEDLAIAAHDPFGFLVHPSIAAALAGAGGGGFSSTDGTAHLVFLDAPRKIAGYREAGAWLDEVRSSLGRWRNDGHRETRVGFTGEPAFSSEIGLAMENDLKGGIALALGLIILLFWWMQRRLKLLGGLVVTLCAVFATALGLAGWLFGELSIIALASAEILIGLATDYGLVICQEAKLTGSDAAALRRASAKPVACGALVTGIVFSALNLGRFPGMAQLGSIVAFGLLAAAALMIVWYLPFVARHGVDRPVPDGSARWLPRRRLSLALTATVLAICGGVLAWKGMPGVDFDSKVMRPRHSEAVETFERMSVKFPAADPGAIPLVVEAGNDAEMAARISSAKERLETAVKSGVLSGYQLPAASWPDPARQSANRAALAAIANDATRLLAEADEAGFTKEGTATGDAVMEVFRKTTAEDGVFFPASPAAREVMGLFVRKKETGGGHVLGSVTPAAANYDALRSLNGNGAWLADWALLKPALSGLLRADLIRMFLPMSCLLLAMMWLVFRSARAVLLALATMAVTTAALLAVMSLAGLKWNFVNLMATPLLLGTGIDYAIHVTLTLKRAHGSIREFWNGTGKALLFCGASNVIGFGSLIWSSSEAMSSLGLVAVIGVVFSMAVSLLLLPGWHARSGLPAAPAPGDSPPLAP